MDNQQQNASNFWTLIVHKKELHLRSKVYWNIEMISLKDLILITIDALIFNLNLISHNFIWVKNQKHFANIVTSKCEQIT